MSNLKKLYAAGQSPWYDNIERRLIKNNGLKDLFDSGIMGVTSNPSIFESAINNSPDYDADIKELIQREMSNAEIYDRLTTQDVAAAADMLLKVYNRTNRVDGYVSIEVLPEYAHDAGRTIDYGRRIFRQLNRPNIMIKVPGTKEGPEAIEALIREGINVNVTLLFSTAHYGTIADAYIAGLRKRLKDGNDISRVNSVASVFVSRVDSRVDTMLDDILAGEPMPQKKETAASLKGKIAVSNCKLIYQLYRDKFFNGTFRELKLRGGNVQRLLWASTSTKNRDYPDLKYVEELIGEDTINTMPQVTVSAFQDHGRIVSQALEKDIDIAKEYLASLSQLGIDIISVCGLIQEEGVAAFQKSFDKLTSSIEAKRQILVTS